MILITRDHQVTQSISGNLKVGPQVHNLSIDMKNQLVIGELFPPFKIKSGRIIQGFAVLTAAVCMRVIGFTGSRDRSLLLFLVAVIIVLEDSYHNVYIFTAAVAAADNG